MKHVLSLFAMTAVVVTGLTVTTIDAADARTVVSEAEHTNVLVTKSKAGEQFAKRKLKKKKRRLNAANQLKTPTTTPPPTGPTSLAADEQKLEDIYCGPGHVPCDDIFIAYCKLIGGTMSGRQPWGGKTCFHRDEW